jgi:hypothetical protein
MTIKLSTRIKSSSQLRVNKDLHRSNFYLSHSQLRIDIGLQKDQSGIEISLTMGDSVERSGAIQEIRQDCK